MRSRKTWFIAGGAVSIMWGLFHIVMFLPLAFDPMMMVDTRSVSDSVTMTDATAIADLITLFNNALIIYMVGIGLLMIFGARTFAASRLGTGLLVIHIAFWAMRAAVPFLQMGRIEEVRATDQVPFLILFMVSLAVFVVPLFLRRRDKPTTPDPTAAF